MLGEAVSAGRLNAETKEVRTIVIQTRGCSRAMACLFSNKINPHHAPCRWTVICAA